MKRNNGGYVLVYVVVVIVILCILVPAACSNSLQNLKAQQASIERMQQLYAAEGQIEQFVAEVLRQREGRESKDNSETAKKTAKDNLTIDLNSVFDNSQTQFSRLSTGEDEPEKYFCQVKAKAGSITVTAKITANLTIETTRYCDSYGEFDHYEYKITGGTFTYESYDISATTAGKGEGQS